MVVPAKSTGMDLVTVEKLLGLLAYRSIRADRWPLCTTLSSAKIVPGGPPPQGHFTTGRSLKAQSCFEIVSFVGLTGFDLLRLTNKNQRRAHQYEDGACRCEMITVLGRRNTEIVSRSENMEGAIERRLMPAETICSFLPSPDTLPYSGR